MGFNSNIGRTDLDASWKFGDVEPGQGWSDPERDNDGNFIKWKKVM